MAFPDTITLYRLVDEDGNKIVAAESLDWINEQKAEYESKGTKCSIITVEIKNPVND